MTLHLHHAIDADALDKAVRRFPHLLSACRISGIAHNEAWVRAIMPQIAREYRLIMAKEPRR